MDTGKLLIFGAVGVAAYYVYTTYFAVPASWTAAGGTAAQWQALSAAQQTQWNTQQSATSVAPAAGAASSGATQQQIADAAAYEAAKAAATAAASPAATMDALYAAIQTASANDPNLVNGAMSGDHWNYYASNIMGKTFPANYGPGNLTLLQYWTAQAPSIKAVTGLAGYNGLGAFAALGDLVARQRYGTAGWTR